MSLLDTIYPTLGAFLYFLALVWTIFLGTDHAAAWPRRTFRTWKRVRPAVHAFVGAWVALTVTMIYGVPGSLLPQGINHAFFEGLQLFAAWVGLPAALWFIARAQGLRFKPHRWWLWAGLLGVAGTFFSELGFIPLKGTFLEPRASPELEQLFTPVAMRQAGLILGILIAPVFEEIIFRGVIQGRLEVFARRHGWTPLVPILLTSLVWTVGHAGIVEPVGIKEIQIFLLGILFSWTRRRFGLLGAITAHGVLNTYAVLTQILEWVG